MHCRAVSGSPAAVLIEADGQLLGAVAVRDVPGAGQDVRGDEAEVLHEGVPLVADRARHLQAVGFGLAALELDALVALVHLDPAQPGEEVEVPEGAAVLAVLGFALAAALVAWEGIQRGHITQTVTESGKITLSTVAFIHTAGMFGFLVVPEEWTFVRGGAPLEVRLYNGVPATARPARPRCQSAASSVASTVSSAAQPSSSRSGRQTTVGSPG